jgi:chromosome segregation ATPase
MEADPELQQFRAEYGTAVESLQPQYQELEQASKVIAETRRELEERLQKLDEADAAVEEANRDLNSTLQYLHDIAARMHIATQELHVNEQRRDRAIADRGKAATPAAIESADDAKMRALQGIDNAYRARAFNFKALRIWLAEHTGEEAIE